ncbi:class I SAM-dependent methyltransferase [Candidatus Solincola sp.]|nr:class I SAM-dependent methyltransferase [Actinomycetota bacterium]
MEAGRRKDSGLLAIMRCLVCAGGELRASSKTGGSDEDPPVVCLSCGREYRVRGGILDFLTDPSPEVVREREAFHGFRPGEPSTPEEWEEHRRTILALPMLEGCSLPLSDLETWRRHGREAFGICKGIEFRGLRVLELGAGRCWFSAHFARRGAEVVAVDILEDEVMGLGCGRFFEEAEGLRIHRVLCDMHRLPFREDSFDVVAATATLHHSPDLPALLAEVRRVLRPGGLLVAANEPLWVPWRETPEEERKGAHEGSYPLWTWAHLLRRAGFNIVEVRAAKGRIASLAFRAVKEGGGAPLAKGLVPGVLRYILLLVLSPLQALRRKLRQAVAGRLMRPLPGDMVSYLRGRFSGTGLVGEARPENPAHWGPGWYAPERPAGEERPFRWSGPRSRLLMPASPKETTLIMELATFHPSPWSRPVEVELRLGSKKLGEARLERHGWHTFSYTVPPGRWRRVYPLTLVVRSGCFRPSELGLGNDSRPLGIACRGVRS